MFKLAKRKYTIVRGLVDSKLVHFLSDYIDLYAIRNAKQRKKSNGVPSNRFGYCDLAVDNLHLTLRERIEKVVGCELLPTFSFFRKYVKGDVLPAHIDRDACEVSLTLNLKTVGAKNWPIYIRTDIDIGDRDQAGPLPSDQVKGREVILKPGDALVYIGTEVKHWRQPFKGIENNQIFMHYVRKRGPFKHLAFDGRKALK